MDDFQEQLHKYRLRKRRKEVVDKFKSKIRFPWPFGKAERQMEVVEITKEADKSPSTSLSEDDFIEDSVGHTLDPPKETWRDGKCLKYTLWTVYFCFWVTVYIIAIELKFGIVFLMFSALFMIYFNTRTGPKKPNEISAYSVFNKDFQSIDGTLKAEQFEREIRYGSSSVR
ncbi:SAYSvFN domain-containing protein 1 [Scaptodrosophila lebanonensis]|uniref:SAYSvFN domain-containing protein 1 n=1 Tax=Drosophila lebanonensis TaxID=7225 RepID=A0A6J2TYL8_DROLE|nr:SAYSvFN domain-containing protein 1 [Scaptodrosophila lebanonensis]